MIKIIIDKLMIWKHFNSGLPLNVDFKKPSFPGQKYSNFQSKIKELF